MLVLFYCVPAEKSIVYDLHLTTPDLTGMNIPSTTTFPARTKPIYINNQTTTPSPPTLDHQRPPGRPHEEHLVVDNPALQTRRDVGPPKLVQ